jgi:cobalt-zinc-cadmium efflux system protein
MVAVGVILWKSVDRWMNPVEVEGITTALIAGVGIIINGMTAWLFVKDKDKDLNIRGAYLHMLADTLVSVGVVFSGLIIWQTNWFWVDTVTSWVIVFMILVSTWSLLKDSIRLSLDGVPKEIDNSKLQDQILTIKGVLSMHHTHIWALSTSENAMTALLVIDNTCTFDDAATIKQEVRHFLEQENIQHVTLELEKEGEKCSAKDCTIVSEQEIHHHH